MGHHSPVNSYSDYVNKWKKAIKEAYAVASCRSRAAGERNKAHYDLKAKYVDLQSNDRVLVRDLSERGGPGKLRSYWENDVHRVICRKEVQRENGTGPVRVLIGIYYSSVTIDQLIRMRLRNKPSQFVVVVIEIVIPIVRVQLYKFL